MKSLFGSVKKAIGSVCNTAKKVAKSAVKTIRRVGVNVKNTVVKGAKQFGSAMSGYAKRIMPSIKNALCSIIKGATKCVGLFYDFFGNNMDEIDDTVLIMVPGGFVIKGLNTIGATDIHPTEIAPKVLAKLFFNTIDTLPENSQQFLEETVLFGYDYDIEQGITYTIPEAPQKEVGYTPTYDLASNEVGFDIAAQIITFQYGDNEYMFEIWKGDYWGAAGSEVGIYVRSADKKVKDKMKDPFFYNCAVDEPMHIKTKLMKGKEVLFTRDDTHWWLTGFKPGEYVEPEELTMYISIEFSNKDMSQKFMKQLEDNCTTATKIEKDGKTVSWVWSYKNTYSIEETVEDYVGKDVTYDEMLKNTMDELMSRGLVSGQGGK